MSVRHFLDFDAVPADQIRLILDEAQRRKAARDPLCGAGRPDADAPAQGRVGALLFMRPSTRTRLSFDIALRQLGASAVVMNAADTQLKRKESLADTARALSVYVDAMAARVADHADLAALASHASIPVVNALSPIAHPCQIVGDLMTVVEHCGPLADRTLVWIGDGNNVAAGFIQTAAVFGFRLRLCCPESGRPDSESVAAAQRAGADLTFFDDPLAAADKADCVMTDTWSSLHHDDDDRAENKEREADLKRFQVDRAIMAAAADGAVFLHCLPAYRGREVAADVIDGPQSRVFAQAANRVHAQKAILLWCWNLI